MLRLDKNQKPTFVDFFCGIGGFHIAAEKFGMECVFASDIDAEARKAYQENFNTIPFGDIKKIDAELVPDHDFLFAGFPCQPFSIIGKRQGFEDPRGSLFFELLRIIKVKRPSGFILENVKQLATANKGAVISKIVNDLNGLGYDVDFKIFNSLDFGLPQKRERTIIVGIMNGLGSFSWPNEKLPMKPLDEILEDDPNPKVYASKNIQKKRRAAHTAAVSPSIWHENKSGNVSSHPYSCALRAGASYNYLLVDGIRRFTARENLRLQGFPDSYKIVCSDSQVRKQAGNAVSVPVIQAVLERLLDAQRRSEAQRDREKAA